MTPQNTYQVPRWTNTHRARGFPPNRRAQLYAKTQDGPTLTELEGSLRIDELKTHAKTQDDPPNQRELHPLTEGDAP